MEMMPRGTAIQTRWDITSAYINNAAAAGGAATTSNNTIAINN
jgi:hypothetical protein